MGLLCRHGIGSLKIVFINCLPQSGNDARASNPKIVGGVKAPDRIAPYLVSLRQTSTNNHFCGGSIIGRRTILTAAHCVEPIYKPSDLYVVAGSNKLLSGGIRFNVTNFVFHDDYDESVIGNDVALVFVDKDFEFDDTISKVELEKEVVGIGHVLLLTGWGSIRHMGPMPNDLQMVFLKSIAFEKCKESMRNINVVEENQLCTYVRFGTGACTGDSGGPLVLNGKQVGIVSWGYPCAIGKPDVFTRVSHFLHWIKTSSCDDFDSRSAGKC